MNIFNIIERNFFRIPGSRCGIGCRLRNSDTEIRIIDNHSRISTDTLVSILNGRIIRNRLYTEIQINVQENREIYVKGRYLENGATGVLCVIKHIQGMPDEFSQCIADAISFIFRQGRLPSYFVGDIIEAEPDSNLRSEAESPFTIKKKNTIIDTDCLIDANEFVDKISKCCNNNSAKIIVRHGDDELKIVDTCIEKGFLYIDVVNPKKLKDILEKH